MIAVGLVFGPGLWVDSRVTEMATAQAMYGQGEGEFETDGSPILARAPTDDLAAILYFALFQFSCSSALLLRTKTFARTL